MTVKELIQSMSECNDDVPVYYQDWSEVTHTATCKMGVSGSIDYFVICTGGVFTEEGEVAS